MADGQKPASLVVISGAPRFVHRGIQPQPPQRSFRDHQPSSNRHPSTHVWPRTLSPDYAGRTVQPTPDRYGTSPGSGSTSPPGCPLMNADRAVTKEISPELTLEQVRRLEPFGKKESVTRGTLLFDE